MHCIHQPDGLCPDCEAERREDPDAWAEFGRTDVGEAAWVELRREMAARQESPPADDLPL